MISVFLVISLVVLMGLFVLRHLSSYSFEDLVHIGW